MKQWLYSSFFIFAQIFLVIILLIAHFIKSIIEFCINNFFYLLILFILGKLIGLL